MITQRQNAILNLIVEMFTRTHEPVCSKALQDSIDSSSATIRNDMAKLEKMGYLEKAHISSGRMPSRAGFQYFVANSLNLDTIDEQDVYQVVKAFDFEAFKLEDILDAAAKPPLPAPRTAAASCTALPACLHTWPSCWTHRRSPDRSYYAAQRRTRRLPFFVPHRGRACPR